jgi:CRP-like cAMP-binding protein
MSAPPFRLDHDGSRIVSLPRGRAIFHQGAAAEAVYRVERGCVRLQLEAEDGERQVIAFLFPGQLLCAGLETHWASAYAVSDCAVAVIPRRRLSAPDGAGDMARALLVSAEGLLAELAQHTARLRRARGMARVRWFLEWAAERSPCGASGSIEATISRRDIADFLGLSPETVSRLFRRLEACGELRRAGRRLIWRGRGEPARSGESLSWA